MHQPWAFHIEKKLEIDLNLEEIVKLMMANLMDFDSPEREIYTRKQNLRRVSVRTLKVLTLPSNLIGRIDKKKNIIFHSIRIYFFLFFSPVYLVWGSLGLWCLMKVHYP